MYRITNNFVKNVLLNIRYRKVIQWCILLDDLVWQMRKGHTTIKLIVDASKLCQKVLEAVPEAGEFVDWLDEFIGFQANCDLVTNMMDMPLED